MIIDEVRQPFGKQGALMCSKDRRIREVIPHEDEETCMKAYNKYLNIQYKNYILTKGEAN